MGAKKFGMPLETREIKHFLGGISRDFAGISWGCPKSLRKKGLGSILVPYKHKSFWPVTPLVPGGSPDWEARGQSLMYDPRNPRNINLFVRIPDREDR